MSQRNGDRSRFNRNRKAKIRRRELDRKLREASPKAAAETEKKK
jgi:hypothetical protein